jgi:hypothetical protein
MPLTAQSDPPRRIWRFPRPNAGSAAEAAELQRMSVFNVVLSIGFTALTYLGSLDLYGDRSFWYWALRFAIDDIAFVFLFLVAVRDWRTARHALTRGRLVHDGLSKWRYQGLIVLLGLPLVCISQAVYLIFGR